MADNFSILVEAELDIIGSLDQIELQIKDLEKQLKARGNRIKIPILIDDKDIARKGKAISKTINESIDINFYDKLGEFGFSKADLAGIDRLKTIYKTIEDDANGIVTEITSATLKNESLFQWTRKISTETNEVLSSEVAITDELKRQRLEKEKLIKSAQKTIAKRSNEIENVRAFKTDYTIRSDKLVARSRQDISEGDIKRIEDFKKQIQNISIYQTESVELTERLAKEYKVLSDSVEKNTSVLKSNRLEAEKQLKVEEAKRNELVKTINLRNKDVQKVRNFKIDSEIKTDKLIARSGEDISEEDVGKLRAYKEEIAKLSLYNKESIERIPQLKNEYKKLSSAVENNTKAAKANRLESEKQLSNQHKLEEFQKNYLSKVKMLRENTKGLISKDAGLRIDDFEDEVKSLSSTMPNLDTKLKTLKNDFNIINREVANTGGTFSKLGRQLTNAFGKFTLWIAASTLFYQSVRFITRGIQYILDLNKSLTEISIVTGKTQQQMAELGMEYQRMAKDMAVLTAELVQGVVELYRQGLSTEETMDRVRTTIQASKIGAMEYKETVELLTAAVNSMNIETEHASDVFTHMGDRTATSYREIAVAFQKVGGTARSLNISFEKVSSWIAHVSATTRESAESIGVSFKTVLSRMAKLTERGFDEEDGTRINDVAKALARVDIALTDTRGEFRNFGDVMDEIGGKWDTMTTRQQALVATAVAGVRQQTRFRNLMEGYAKSVELYESSLSAAGETQEKYNLWLASTEAALNELKTTSTGIWQEFFDTEQLKVAISVLTALVSVFGRLLIAVGPLPMAFSAIYITLKLMDKDIRLSVVKTLMLLGRQIGAVAKAFAAATLAVWNFGAASLQSIVAAEGLALSATKLAASLGKIALMLKPLLIITTVIYVASKAMQHMEQVTQRARTAINEFVSSMKELNNQEKSLKDLSEEYKALYDNENRTASQQARFNELTREIGSIVPTAISHVNELGETVLKYGGNIDAVIDSLKEMREQENILLQSQMGDVFDSAKKDVIKYERELKKLQKKLTDLQTVGIFDPDNHEFTTKSLKQLEADFKRATNLEDRAKIAGEIKAVNKEIENTQKQIKAVEIQIDGAQAPVQLGINSLLRYSEGFGELSNQMQSMTISMIEDLSLPDYLDYDAMSIYVNKLVETLAALEQGQAKGEIQELYNEYNRLAEEFKNTGEGAEALDAAANKLTDSMHRLFGVFPAESFKDFAPDSSQIKTYAQQAEDDFNNYEKVTSGIKGTAEKLGLLTEAQNEYEESGNLTIDMIEKLKAAFPEMEDLHDLSAKSVKKFADQKIRALQDEIVMQKRAYEAEAEIIRLKLEANAKLEDYLKENPKMAMTPDGVTLMSDEEKKNAEIKLNFLQQVSSLYGNMSNQIRSATDKQNEFNDPKGTKKYMAIIEETVDSYKLVLDVQDQINENGFVDQETLEQLKQVFPEIESVYDMSIDSLKNFTDVQIEEMETQIETLKERFKAELIALDPVILKYDELIAKLIATGNTYDDIWADKLENKRSEKNSYIDNAVKAFEDAIIKLRNSGKKAGSSSSVDGYDIFISHRQNIEDLQHEIAMLDERIENADSFEARNVAMEEQKVKYQELIQANSDYVNDVRRRRDELEGVLSKSGFRFAGEGDERMITNHSNIVGKSSEVEEKLNEYYSLQQDLLPQIKEDNAALQNEIKDIESEIVRDRVENMLKPYVALDEAAERELRKLQNRLQSEDTSDSEKIDIQKRIGAIYADRIVKTREEIALLKGIYEANEGNLEVQEEINETIDDRTEKLDDYEDQLRRSQQQQNKLIMDAAKFVENKVVAYIKARYQAERDYQDELHQDRLNDFDDELDAFKSMIDSKKKALNDQYEEEDYQNELKAAQEEALLIQKEIAKYSTDNSLESRNKVIDLQKKLAEKEASITKMQTERSRKLQTDYLDDQTEKYEGYVQSKIDAEEREYDSYKKDLDARLSDASVYAEAHQAIQDGMIEDFNGQMVSLQDALVEFEYQFGEGMTVAGESIESQLITSLEIVNNKLIAIKNSGLEAADAIKAFAGLNEVVQMRSFLESLGYNVGWSREGGVTVNNVQVDTSGLVLNAEDRFEGTRNEILEMLRAAGVFASGGINTTPGLAALHGTSQRAEVIFNATDAKKLYNLVRELPINISDFTSKVASIPMKFELSIGNLVNVEGNATQEVLEKIKRESENIAEKLRNEIFAAGLG